jgi:hypothetical protein
MILFVERAPQARDVVERLFREEQGRAVATLIRVLGEVERAYLEGRLGEVRAAGDRAT